MEDLSAYEELTNITFDHDNAHLAVCHKLQGYSANGTPDALLFKSKSPLPVEVMKSLEDVYDKEQIEKMSFKNKQRIIEATIEQAIKTATGEEWAYVWLRDFSEDLAIFDYKDNLYAVKYTSNDQGLVAITGDVLTPVIRGDMYISLEDGSEVLMKASQWKELSVISDENATVDLNSVNKAGDEPVSNNKGKQTMSDQNEITQEMLEKAKADAVLVALEKAKLEWEQELATKELTKATTSIVKSFAFVADEGQAELVKGLVSLEDGGALIIKAFEAAAELVEKAEADKEAIKKEFGEKEAAVVEETVEEDEPKSKEDVIKAKVAAIKAAKLANS